ncbi:MAG: DUF1460 domain-containing protein, partial [Syntrophales bacterium]|nr:DUF1460 domain-containing protein [Syntrophales bacterium]
MKIASIYAICNLKANQEGTPLPASPADIKIIQALLRPGRWEGQTLKSSGELALAVGSHFLGTPYVAGTLEQEKGESLQINLRQLDCFTFVENTMA